MPENLVDGVSRVSGGLRGIPNNMLGGVGRLFNVKLVRLAVVAPPPPYVAFFSAVCACVRFL